MLLALLGLAAGGAAWLLVAPRTVQLVGRTAPAPSQDALVRELPVLRGHAARAQLHVVSEPIAESQRAPSAVLRGRCVTAGGNAVEGATAALEIAYPPSSLFASQSRVRTAADGAFEMPLEVSGSARARVVLSAQGFASRAIYLPPLRRGSSVDLDVVLLERGIRVTGTVVTESEQAAPGALVSWELRQQGNVGPPEWAGETMADEEGRFDLGLIASGVVHFFVRTNTSPLTEVGTVPVHEGDGSRHARLVVADSAQVLVLVTSAAGERVEAVEFVAPYSGRILNERSVLPAERASNGETWRVYVPRQINVPLRVFAPGYRSAQLDVPPSALLGAHGRPLRVELRHAAQALTLRIGGSRPGETWHVGADAGGDDVLPALHPIAVDPNGIAEVESTDVWTPRAGERIVVVHWPTKRYGISSFMTYQELSSGEPMDVATADLSRIRVSVADSASGRGVGAAAVRVFADPRPNPQGLSALLGAFIITRSGRIPSNHELQSTSTDAAGHADIWVVPQYAFRLRIEARDTQPPTYPIGQVASETR